MKELYYEYLDFLQEWAETRYDPYYIGMSPPGFDEWLDCERSER